MGSSVETRISAIGEALELAVSGGYSRKETSEFCPAVDFVSDDFQALLAPEHFLASAPQAPPEAAGPSHLPTGTSRLDKLFEIHFQRLELELEVLKAQQLVGPELLNVREGIVPAQILEFSSVTQGNVPVLDVVEVKAEGEVVFKSVLVERKAGVKK